MVSNATDNVTLSAMYDLIRDIEKLDNVKSISGIALPDSAMNKSSVLDFWSTPSEYLPIESQYARQALADNFLAEDFTFILVVIDGTDTSVESRELTVETRELAGKMIEELNRR